MVTTSRRTLAKFLLTVGLQCLRQHVIKYRQNGLGKIR